MSGNRSRLIDERVQSTTIEVADSSDRVAIVSTGLEEGDEVLLGLPTSL